MMDVKEAVRTAKKYVAELFVDEGVVNLGLEEVEHDDSNGVWNITLGFSRPWDNDAFSRVFVASGRGGSDRSYKVIKIRESDGQVISVKVRDVKAE